jgi:hypothetical protein
MTVDQYWMGKDIDVDGIWRDFDSGQGYISKVAGSPLYLLRMSFGGHPLDLPLFDHEAIYKTVKATFHDVKAECLTPDAYDRAAPVFLYRVDRGSGVFEFLAQFDPLMTWVVALGAASMWYRNAVRKDQAFDTERLDFIRRNFPGASAGDVQAYMKAWTTFGRRRVLHRLISQGLLRLEVSQTPHRPGQPPLMIDMTTIIELGPERGSDGPRRGE